MLIKNLILQTEASIAFIEVALDKWSDWHVVDEAALGKDVGGDPDFSLEIVCRSLAAGCSYPDSPKRFLPFVTTIGFEQRGKEPHARAAPCLDEIFAVAAADDRSSIFLVLVINPFFGHNVLVLYCHVLLDVVEPQVLVAIRNDTLDAAVGAVFLMRQDPLQFCCVVASSPMIFAGNVEMEDLEKTNKVI